LAPKLQEIAREDIAVAVIDTINQTTVYATDSLDTEDTFMKPVWLLPGYQVGLSLQGNSLTQLVRQRADNNIVIASIMLGLMAIGVWLIVRNLLKEMRLAQTKSDFVANVSHEIRTPLALISMFAETLVMDRVPSEEKKKEYYNIIIKETARLRNIVNKILNFSQIEAKKKQYQFEAIDVNKIVLQVVDTYEFHLRSKGFEYELKLQARDMVIEADEEAVVETLINLIDNAIKYSDKEKHIEISTFVKNDKVAIALTDRGIGIPKNLQGQVFDKFYRVTSKNVYHTMGTGLGLTLVKNIMTAHQGDVEVESKPGEGSTFTLWFPIKQQENA
jgi:two-component system phosphate regulon sensor histidine kinase PhoR